LQRVPAALQSLLGMRLRWLAGAWLLPPAQALPVLSVLLLLLMPLCLVFRSPSRPVEPTQVEFAARPADDR
jgi:hypothetical protein